MTNLGSNLRQARLARGLSQDEVAGVIGLTRPTYALVEAGKRDITLSQVETLAAILRVSEEGLRGAPDGVSTLANPMSSVEKYKQIILNALQSGADDDGKITKTKLAKLVYLADFNWYYEHLVPMSGMSYRKLPRGPVADVYFRALDELEEDGIIDREEKGKAILFSLMESGAAPANRLSHDEKKMIQYIGKAWHGRQTQEIVDFTHSQLPWQICREGEVIPYGLITQEDPERIWKPQTTA